VKVEACMDYIQLRDEGNGVPKTKKLNSVA
jgi:hypothetical protein